MGIWNTMLPYLNIEEQQLLQLGDRFCYDSAIGRVVTYFLVFRMPIPYINDRKEIAVYNLALQRPLIIDIPSQYDLS